MVDLQAMLDREIKNVDVVSFDIFNTIVLRKTISPHRVFEVAYEEAKECFPEYIKAEDWRSIRVALPSFAKKKKPAEAVTLDDYLAEVPFFIKDTERLRKAEIEAEIKCAYANPEVYSSLLLCKKKHGKKIILVSDMYLSKQDISKILTGIGIDLKYIDEIYVSNEFGRRKSSSTLYEQISKDMGISPERIIHIGDNWKSDFINARKSGWRAIYYSTVSEAPYKYPYLHYESQLFHQDACLAETIYSLRCLAASHSEGDDQEKAWFETGAMTFGPLMTFAAEWVLEQAEINSIKNIYPLMREGVFFTRLIKRAAEKRNWNGRIEPLFISRRALYPALLSVIEERDVFFSFLANTGISRNLTVGEVLDMYKVDSNSKLYDYKDIVMREARDINYNGVPLTQFMNEVLFSKIEETRMENTEADELIWKYFCTLNMHNEKFITVDFGYGGTTQNAIERILNKRGINEQGLHLLVIGKETIAKRRNFSSHTDIRGFASMLGSNKIYTDSMNSQICDSLLKCEYGSVIGYSSVDDKVLPKFGTPDYNVDTLRLVEAFQRGIFEFQSTYYSVKDIDRRKINITRSELLKLAARLTVYPTTKEAKMLGLLSSDNEQIINEKEIAEYAELGFEKFFHDRFRKNKGMQWYCGMDAIVDGTKYYRESSLSIKNENYMLYSMYAKRLANLVKIVLYGTIEEIWFMVWGLELIDQWMLVDSVVVENLAEESTKGERIHGKRICTINDVDKDSTIVLLTRNRDKIIEIRNEFKNSLLEKKMVDFYS